MARHIRTALALAALVGMAGAADLPGEGRVDSSLCFGGPMQVVSDAAGNSMGSYLIKGGTSASEMVFDSMVAQCVGSFATNGGRTVSQGTCVFRDADGDIIHGTDAVTPDGYVWAFVGGTGKFQGISGSGTVERWGTLAPTADSLRGCRRFVGSYRMR